MEILILLIPMAIVMGALFVGGFVWMTMSGQYDDLETPSHRMLLDDNQKTIKTDENNINNPTHEGEV